MRRETPIAGLLYRHLYPHPTPNDPPTFSAHLARNLVPEVRIEVATFYGDLNSTEARYPGLNYCHPPHRMRLGRFKYHRRLFEAFDALGLTYAEIQEFCCWEGTRWARERFERDEGIKVRDTTGDEIGPFVDRRVLREREGMEGLEGRRRSITRKTDIEVVVEHARGQQRQTILEEDEEGEDDEAMSGADEAEEADREADDGEDEDDDEGEETPTEAAARNEHMAFLARRRDTSVFERVLAAYRSGENLPPEIEQFIKEASERGQLPLSADVVEVLARRYLPLTSARAGTAPAAVFTPRPVA